MHGEPNQRSDHGCTDSEDALAQAGVLGFVIEEHPDHMTLSELVLAKRRQPERLGERHVIEQAVRELVGAGLLHRHGEFVVPTRAALFMSQFDLGLA